MSLDTIMLAVDRFQVLIASGLAIVAAGIAYRGARRQAQAILDAEDRRTASHRRAVAAALFAELVSIGTRLYADIRTLRSSPPGLEFGLQAIDLSIFSANPSAVGHMPSDEAFMVTQVYKLVMDVNRSYDQARKPGYDPDYEPHRLEKRIGPVVRQIRITLRGIRETAGVPEDKAQAMIGPWSPEETDNAA